MARVINRTTLEMRRSVNTPEYSPATWIINPDLSSLYNWNTDTYLVPKYYWKVVGDSVLEMDAGEKAVVDAQRLADAKISRKDWLNDRGTEYLLERYSESENRELHTLYTDAIRVRPRRAAYIQPWIDWLDEINEEVKAEQDVVDTKSTIEEVDSVVLDESTLTSNDPLVSVDGANAILDGGSSPVRSFLDANAIVTDPTTGIEGPWYVMQELEHRKDLYNDAENPIYDSGHTPILGNGGILVDHANRILNLETIHGKLGWHNQQITRATYRKPKDLLVYYGYPNSFNSGTNQWYNEKVAQDMSKYGVIVLGDGVEDPAHGDYSNTIVIIPRIKQLNPEALIFGYVAAAQSLVDFQTKVDQWNTLAVHGIFIDEAGYDYGKTRAEFNVMVDYVHGKSVADIVFANSWNTDNILGTAEDASFPNSTFNPSLVESKLTSSDWILLESFPINTSAYTTAGYLGYESKSDWLARGDKAVSLRETYGVNFAGNGVINNGNGSGQALFNFGFTSAMMFALEGFGTSDTNYGASSATVAWWTRPDVSNMGVVYQLVPSVTVDALDADVYRRCVESGNLMVDFSQSAQTSSVTKY